MTALEFIAAGVTFTAIGGAYVIAGPRGRADLMTALRSEVDRRMALMREPRTRDGHVDGTCETCGDPMALGRGGWCVICAVARVRSLVALGRLPS